MLENAVFLAFPCCTLLSHLLNIYAFDTLMVTQILIYLVEYRVVIIFLSSSLPLSFRTTYYLLTEYSKNPNISNHILILPTTTTIPTPSMASSSDDNLFAIADLKHEMRQALEAILNEIDASMSGADVPVEIDRLWLIQRVGYAIPQMKYLLVSNNPEKAHGQLLKHHSEHANDLGDLGCLPCEIWDMTYTHWVLTAGAAKNTVLIQCSPPLIEEVSDALFMHGIFQLVLNFASIRRYSQFLFHKTSPTRSEFSVSESILESNI